MKKKGTVVKKVLSIYNCEAIMTRVWCISLIYSVPPPKKNLLFFKKEN